MFSLTMGNIEETVNRSENKKKENISEAAVVPRGTCTLLKDNLF